MLSGFVTTPLLLIVLLLAGNRIADRDHEITALRAQASACVGPYQLPAAGPAIEDMGRE